MHSAQLAYVSTHPLVAPHQIPGTRQVGRLMFYLFNWCRLVLGMHGHAPTLYACRAAGVLLRGRQLLPGGLGLRREKVRGMGCSGTRLEGAPLCVYKHTSTTRTQKKRIGIVR
jgi:hypothetical protein